ncbi:HAMP domain-containing protein [Pontibacillus yanchengensis]|uniref:HAMP domain-containing protein n=1 Tax=Pontibacillus yanchengensis TaxID=462910 RepID=A0ACC7VIN6_9BACI|nr:sensor histidine kinase [Pontibacillus yanchengensis]MYL54648.1 HAMP domain-containing protein [Pontibacillus yanchengensis]
MKYRHKLMIAFTVIALFPMSIFGVYAYQSAVSHTKEKALTYGRTMATDLNSTYNEWIQDSITLTRSMIGDPQLETLLKKDFESYQYPVYEKVQDKKSYQYYLNHTMNVYPSVDYVLLYPLKQPYTIGYSNQNVLVSEENNGNDRWYEKTMSAEGYWVYTGLHKESQIVEDPKVVSISRLIKDSQTQEPLGVIKVMYNSQSIYNLLNQKARTSNFSFLLTNDNGETMATSEHVEEGFGGVIAQGENDDEVSYKDQSYFITSSTSDETGWTVYAISDRDQLFQQLNSIKKIFLYLLIGTIVGSIVLAYLISSRLVRPLEHLKSSMSQLTTGEWKQIPDPNRKDEIGDLTYHYNDMLTRLDEYVALLVQKEKQKKDLEYKSLQSQINPHFLFNTLNNIKWCVYLNQPDLVNRMIDSLVYIFKFISKRSDDMIPLSEEEEFLHHYLQIMKIRFDGEFEVIWEMNEDVKDMEVPILLIQPLLENAIIHGMEKENEDRMIWLRAYSKAPNRVIIEVEDNGVGFSEDRPQQKGVKFSSIGFDNVKERVRLMYGNQGSITVQSKANEGTIVTLDLSDSLP